MASLRYRFANSTEGRKNGFEEPQSVVQIAVIGWFFFGHRPKRVEMTEKIESIRLEYLIL